MRLVQRGAEPGELRTTRALSRDQGGTYANLPKPPVIAALLRDQGGLCGFCMRRVGAYERDARGAVLLDAQGQPRWRKAANGTTWPWKIAHWSPQSHDEHDEARALDWANMIGACRGGDDGDGPRTCDTLQGNHALTVDPYRRTTLVSVRGQSARRAATPKEGEVESTGYELYADDPNVHDDLRLRLGLNRGYLPDNRAQVLQAFRAHLQKRLPAHATLPAPQKEAAVRQLYEEWKWESRAEGLLRPFCGVVEVHYKLTR